MPEFAFPISCMWVLLPDTPIQFQHQALEDLQSQLQRCMTKMKRLQITSGLNRDLMRVMPSIKLLASKWLCLEIFNSLPLRAFLLHRCRRMFGYRVQTV